MDGAVLKEYPLNKERTTIGRKPHNDVVIDNLAVSSEHAAIVTILNDSFLEDLDSTNGLTVNGTATKKHFLQNNDLIEMANDNGGRDNVSVILVKVNGKFSAPRGWVAKLLSWFKN